jgi:mannobiose 2-epimerase
MDLPLFKNELQQELHNVLHYWMQYTIDEVHGGFCGKVDNDNKCYSDAPKGCVLNARILWTFSAAFNLTHEPQYAPVATRAFEYIQNYFVDNLYGGVYWSVTNRGEPLDTKKQIYALAFVIYACSEYYRMQQWAPAKKLAIQLYELIQRYSYDSKKGGYFEAFARDWQPLADLRLSNKDANEKKTMNTHLHILEAYSSLYGIWPDAQLAQAITLLLNNFDDHIIHKQAGHLHLFFDENWGVKSDTVSYGHDIEASWLLVEAAETIGNDSLIKKMKAHALKMADAVTRGIDTDGGLWYEYEPSHRKLIKEKHWWPQAEALVGYFNAWQISGNDKYLQYVFNNWAFIKQYIRDNKNGEWFWGVSEDHSVMPDQDKAGFWKCPYHNGRACMELIKRLSVTY